MNSVLIHHLMNKAHFCMFNWHEKIKSLYQDLHSLPAPLRLAEEMGKMLGRG